MSSLSINTNLAAMTAHRSMEVNTNAMDQVSSVSAPDSASTAPPTILLDLPSPRTWKPRTPG